MTYILRILLPTLLSFGVVTSHIQILAPTHIGLQQLATPSPIAALTKIEQAKNFLKQHLYTLKADVRLILFLRLMNNRPLTHPTDPIHKDVESLHSKWKAYLDQVGASHLPPFEDLLSDTAQDRIEQHLKTTPFHEENKPFFTHYYHTANDCYFAQVGNNPDKNRYFVKIPYHETGLLHLLQELYIYDSLFAFLKKHEGYAPLKRYFLDEVEGPFIFSFEGKYRAGIYLNMLPWPALHGLIEQEKIKDVENILKIIEQILEAFSLLEEAGIYVWDIKTENIQVEPESLQVKVIDFGHSFIEGNNWLRFPPEPYKVRNHFYAAPEEVKADLNKEALQYRSSAEVWKLGVIFYELLFKGAHPIKNVTKQKWQL